MGDLPKPPVPDIVLSIFAGDWPKGSETRMRELADIWDAAAEDYENAKKDGQQARDQLLAAIESDSEEAMRTSVNQLLEDEGGIQAQIDDARELAQMCRSYADELVTTKYIIYAAMAEAAASLVGLFLGPLGWGAAAAKVAAKRAAMRGVIKGVISRVAGKAASSAASRLGKAAAAKTPRMAKAVATEVASQAAGNAAVTAAGQTAAYMDSGVAFDPSRTAQAAAGGAAFGVGSGAVRGARGRGGLATNLMSGAGGAVTSGASAGGVEADDIAGSMVESAAGGTNTSNSTTTTSNYQSNARSASPDSAVSAPGYESPTAQPSTSTDSTPPNPSETAKPNTQDISASHGNSTPSAAEGPATATGGDTPPPDGGETYTPPNMGESTASNSPAADSSPTQGNQAQAAADIGASDSQAAAENASHPSGIGQGADGSTSAGESHPDAAGDASDTSLSGGDGQHSADSQQSAGDSQTATGDSQSSHTPHSAGDSQTATEAQSSADSHTGTDSQTNQESPNPQAATSESGSHPGADSTASPSESTGTPSDSTASPSESAPTGETNSNTSSSSDTQTSDSAPTESHSPRATEPTADQPHSAGERPQSEQPAQADLGSTATPISESPAHSASDQSTSTDSAHTSTSAGHSPDAPSTAHSTESGTTRSDDPDPGGPAERPAAIADSQGRLLDDGQHADSANTAAPAGAAPIGAASAPPSSASPPSTPGSTTSRPSASTGTAPGKPADHNAGEAATDTDSDSDTASTESDGPTAPQATDTATTDSQSTDPVRESDSSGDTVGTPGDDIGTSPAATHAAADSNLDSRVRQMDSVAETSDSAEHTSGREGTHEASPDTQSTDPAQTSSPQANPAPPIDREMARCAQYALHDAQERHNTRFGPLPDTESVAAGQVHAAVGSKPHVDANLGGDPDKTTAAWNRIADHLQGKPGATAVVTVSWADSNENGHVFLAENNNGRIEFYDPATGERHPWPPTYTHVNAVASSVINPDGTPAHPVDPAVDPSPYDEASAAVGDVDGNKPPIVYGEYEEIDPSEAPAELRQYLDNLPVDARNHASEPMVKVRTGTLPNGKQILDYRMERTFADSLPGSLHNETASPRDGENVTMVSTAISAPFEAGGEPDPNSAYNSAMWEVHGDRTVYGEADIHHSYPGIGRTSSELAAQRAVHKDEAKYEPKDDDHAGHIFGHQFFPSQGAPNFFAQNGNFNTSAYNKMEGEWANWVNSEYGRDVHVKIETIFFFDDGGNRPSTLTVDYEVRAPDRDGKDDLIKTDKANTTARTEEFDNEARVQFDHTKKAEIDKILREYLAKLEEAK